MAPRSKPGHIWEDKEILFDLPYSYLRLRPGEKIMERLDAIEDTKGNSGVRGRMVVTNLRLIWHAVTSPRINLSIGLECVSSVSSRLVSSGLRGSTQALHVLACCASSRYEFIFTNLQPDSAEHYLAVGGVHKAYNSSRMYRELKLRAAIIHNKQLRMLPDETISLNEHGVWNLSSDTGNLGTLVATNVRVVWYADVNAAFNVSLPYIAVESVAVRASKFGDALVVTSAEGAGGYVLGFRADPPARLRTLHAELAALHRAYSAKPVFGVRRDWDGGTPPDSRADELEELEEVGEPRGEMGPALYLAGAGAGGGAAGAEAAAPVFSAYLGLAVEPLREGFTLKGLFEVQTS